MPRKKGKASGTEGVRRGHGSGWDSPGAYAKPPTTAWTVSGNDFTLRDEARHTASYHQSRWLRDARLRDRPVVFQSAGLIAPLEEPTPNPPTISSSGRPDSLGDSEQKNPAHGAPDDGQPADGEPSGKSADDDTTASPALQAPPGFPCRDEIQTDSSILSPPTELHFVVDLTGDKSLRRQLPARPKSIDGHPAPDESSEADHESDSSAEVIVFKGRRRDERYERHERPEQSAADPSNFLSDVRGLARDVLTDVNNEAEEPSNTTFVTHKTTGLHPTSKSEEDEAIAADYIANMDDNSDDDLAERHFARRELGGSDGFSPGVIDISEVSSAYENKLVPRDAWGDRGKGADDGGDRGIDDDKSGADTGQNDGDSEVSAEHSETGSDDATVGDEALAQLLAKQEELGIGSDKLLLLSGSHATVGMSSAPGDAADVLTATRGMMRTSKSGGRLSAAAIADAFEDLDLMDWKQPGRQRKAKGRRGPPEFNISDSELEAVLSNAWQNDRSKKKQRKLQREELRAQGQLRKGADTGDLRVKYPTAMTFEDIKTELKAFLVGSDERLEFPPMDKHARKTLHELANRFNIKSMSSGSGDQRRPVLYRTKTTLKYGEAYFEKATLRGGRKFFPRLDAKQGMASQRLGAGKGGHGGVMYRDGDVVGGSAPELGEGNKGRAMLQKMGWSTGMALGASDNKGILQPVAHVVRRTKAGLG